MGQFNSSGVAPLFGKSGKSSTSKGGFVDNPTGYYGKGGSVNNSNWAILPATEDGGKINYEGYLSKFESGGYPILDPRGQCDLPGKVTSIPSNTITMAGVHYPVLGISDIGHMQMMEPNKDYKFQGNSVTEYPMMKAQLGGKPTTSDSLDLYNNSKQVLDYYRNNKYRESPEKTNPSSAHALQQDALKDLKHRMTMGSDFYPQTNRSSTPNNTGGNLSDKKFTMDDYYKKSVTNPNQFFQREATNSMLDLRSPMTLYDNRITPTKTYHFENKKVGDPLEGDVVDVPEYDPIAIKPAAMKTPQDWAYMRKTYGNPVTIKKKENIETINTGKLPQITQESNRQLQTIDTLPSEMVRPSGNKVFSRPRQPSESGSSSFPDRVTPQVDYFDAKTGKPVEQARGGKVGFTIYKLDKFPLEKAKNGGQVEWKIVDEMQNGGSLPKIKNPYEGATIGSDKIIYSPEEQNQIDNNAHRNLAERANYNNRQRTINTANQVHQLPQSEQWKSENLQKSSAAIGNRFSLQLHAGDYGDPSKHPSTSTLLGMVDWFNPLMRVGDMAAGLGSVPQDIKEGKYKKVALEVGTPLAFGMLDGIKLKGTSSEIPKTVYNLEDPASEAQYIINHPEKSGLPKLVNQEDRDISELTITPQRLLKRDNLILNPEDLVNYRKGFYNHGEPIFDSYNYYNDKSNFLSKAGLSAFYHNDQLIRPYIKENFKAITNRELINYNRLNGVTSPLQQNAKGGKVNMQIHDGNAQWRIIE